MNPETNKLIENIKEYYKVSNLSELNNQHWKEISGYNDVWKNHLTEEFIDTYSDKLNWFYISRYQQLSEPFMKKYEDKLNWGSISGFQTLSEPFMEKYTDKLNWGNISGFQTLSESFIEKHADKLNLKLISKYQKLSENFIERHTDKVDWNYISRYQNLSSKFVKKYSNRINYKNLFYNERLNIKEKTEKLEEYPEWTDFFISAEKKDIKLYRHIIKQKFQTQEFWKSYINYLKSEYPDKNMFKVKLFDRIIEISDIFNMDKNKILKIINKSLKKEEKKVEVNR